MSRSFINMTPESNGAHAFQTRNDNFIPENCAIVPDELLDTIKPLLPFVTFTTMTVDAEDVELPVVVEVADNADARAAYEVAKLEEQAANFVKLKEAKQAENNTALATFLATNPITFSDGKQYGVTIADQTEITLNLTQYQLAVAAGVTPTLEWHAVHEECLPWEYADLTALSLAISAFVYPYIRQNQALKVQIYAAQTNAELDAIEISYEVVNA